MAGALVFGERSSFEKYTSTEYQNNSGDFSYRPVGPLGELICTSRLEEFAGRVKSSAPAELIEQTGLIYIALLLDKKDFLDFLLSPSAPIIEKTDLSLILHANSIMDYYPLLLSKNYLTQENKNTLLSHLCTSQNQHGNIKLLLSTGADPNGIYFYNYDGKQPLIFKLAEDVQYETLKLLIEYGANLNALSSAGKSIARIAAEVYTGASAQSRIDDQKKLIQFLKAKNAPFTPKLTFVEKIKLLFKANLLNLF